jgi:alpha-tubulin suppressor-like RCC1 family protein
MPNFSGVWNLKDQVQAIAAGRWTGIPTFELYAWGLGTSGQTGLGDAINKSSPTQIGNLANWSKVDSGVSHVSAIKTDGTLWSWGSGGNGQLGEGTTVSRSSPIQVGALTTWYQVSAGSTFSGAVKTDGTLWMWGSNNGGRLGDNTTNYKSSPVQIGALTDWRQVSAGGYHTLAVKTNNTLWAWGNNQVAGQLGLNDIIRRSSPVQVGALTNWSAVSAGQQHSLAVKTDGTLWAWGSNYEGRLGLASASTFRSSPVQVGALTDWSTVTAGYNHSGAVKSNGTLWTWGLGQGCGLGDTINRSSPTQVGALSDWSNVSAGRGQTGAVRSNGTLWSWGQNSNGQLGDGTVVNKSSPVQVGSSTSWSDISLGSFFTISILQGSSN